MSGVDWTPIERAAVRVRGVDPEFNGLLDVVVELSRTAPPEWCAFVERPVGVPTSLDMHRPKASGASVSIRPPDNELERYVEHLDECIAAANARYESEIVPRRRAQIAKREAETERIRAAADRASGL